MALLREWALGFGALNEIERSLSDLIDQRASHPVQPINAVVTAEDAIAKIEPGGMLIDCTGSRSMLRDHLTMDGDVAEDDAITLEVRLEYALVITFLYGEHYDCNGFAKTFPASPSRWTGSSTRSGRSLDDPFAMPEKLHIYESRAPGADSGPRSPQDQDLREY